MISLWSNNMMTLAVFLMVLIAGMVSLAGLPPIVSLPLTVVLGAFALIILTEMCRTYQGLVAARTSPRNAPAGDARA